jgi:hypothetical protein
LRRKPIGSFSSEELRIMIGQGIGLPWLVPLALEQLETNPLVEGDFFPGDLLASVLRIGPEFWAQEWEWRQRTRALLERLARIPKDLEEAVATFRQHAA